MYRHDRLAYLKQEIAVARENSIHYGIKLVRGAYMEKERAVALEKNKLSPIQLSKEATDADYDEAVRFCMDHIHSTAVIIASHNEQSNLLGAKLLDEMMLPHNHPHVHFSQLYGMSDTITFNLAKEGFNVSKYLPFGPIQDVVPYLMRRAQENTSVSGQTGRELMQLKRELARRKSL
jgi:proline dehydrogenase